MTGVSSVYNFLNKTGAQRDEGPSRAPRGSAYASEDWGRMRQSQHQVRPGGDADLRPTRPAGGGSSAGRDSGVKIWANHKTREAVLR